MDVAKHPTMHRTAPYIELAQNVSSAKVERAQPRFIEICGTDLSDIQSCSTAAKPEITVEILITLKITKKGEIKRQKSTLDGQFW